MSDRAIAPGTYLIICVILIAMTFVTVGVSFVRLQGPWHLVIGLVIALTKATLVVLFFMHALFSPRLTRLVIWISVFWLGILLVLTFTDYLSRDMVAFMPGH